MKNSLNMTYDLHNERRNSNSSTSSNNYKNEIKYSHRKTELNNTI